MLDIALDEQINALRDVVDDLLRTKPRDRTPQFSRRIIAVEAAIETLTNLQTHTDAAEAL